MKVGQAKRAYAVLSTFVQATQSLDAVDLGRQQAQHRSLVATAGADFQHPSEQTGLALAQQLDHASDYVGFGDGLPQPDGQTRVLIRLVSEARVHKAMALDGSKSFQQQRVPDTAGLQFRHHGQSPRHRVSFITVQAGGGSLNRSHPRPRLAGQQRRTHCATGKPARTVQLNRKLRALRGHGFALPSAWAWSERDHWDHCDHGPKAS